jgi:Fe-S-cluster containining protein
MSKITAGLPLHVKRRLEFEERYAEVYGPKFGKITGLGASEPKDLSAIDREIAERYGQVPKELPVIQSPKPNFDCAKCPGYCCTYEWIAVTRADVKRLAKAHGLSYEQAERRFTKLIKSYGRVLRHREDEHYGTACRFLDPQTRRCTTYASRPAVCREYPEDNHCGYFDFLMWERKHQDDPEFVA